MSHKELTGVRSAATIAKPVSPLRLDIQFFADPPADPKDPKKPDGDPPPPDDDELSLADLLKTNPKIKAEYKEKVEAAIQKRFKNYDFDPEEARTALREKKERDEGSSDDQVKVNDTIIALTKTNQKLEAKLKTAEVAAYASANGINPKLLTRLAGSQIEGLELSDKYELDASDLEDIVDDLRAEFPEQFPVTTDPKDPGAGAAPPPPVKKPYNPGTQQTNNPEGGKPNPEADVAATLERLKKSKRIQ